LLHILVDPYLSLLHDFLMIITVVNVGSMIITIVNVVATFVPGSEIINVGCCLNPKKSKYPWF
jgi:hypothetical protein